MCNAFNRFMITILILCLFVMIMPVKVAAAVTIALDPGHGGDENGADYYGEKEKDVDLKLAQYVKEGLEEYDGVNIVLTRDKDEAAGLKDRVITAYNAGADMFISLHCNASVSHKSHGASVYISTGEARRQSLRDFADLFLGEFEAIGLDNAGTFARVTQMGRRREDGSFDDYYGVLRHSYNYGIPAIIVEHCFMDSIEDWKFVRNEDGIKELAQADVRAIAAYYGLTSKDGTTYEGRHARQYGATTKAISYSYFVPPKLLSVKLCDYNNASPSMAEYEVNIEDGVGVNYIYLVYKNGSGNSFTVNLMLGEELKTGQYKLKGYIPDNLDLQYYTLSYVGLYDKVGFDAGYSNSGGKLIGFGKCDWLNSFAYSGEADLSVKEQKAVSAVLKERLNYEIMMGIRKRQCVYPLEYRR